MNSKKQDTMDHEKEDWFLQQAERLWNVEDSVKDILDEFERLYYRRGSYSNYGNTRYRITVGVFGILIVVLGFYLLIGMILISMFLFACSLASAIVKGVAEVGGEAYEEYRIELEQEAEARRRYEATPEYAREQEELRKKEEHKARMKQEKKAQKRREQEREEIAKEERRRAKQEEKLRKLEQKRREELERQFHMEEQKRKKREEKEYEARRKHGSVH